MFNRIQGGTEKNVDPGFTKWASTIGPNVLEYIPSSAKLSEMVQTGEAAIFPLTPRQWPRRRRAACRWNMRSPRKVRWRTAETRTRSGRRERYSLLRECAKQLGVHRHELDTQLQGQGNEFAVVRGAIAAANQFEHARRFDLVQGHRRTCATARA